MSKRYCNQRKGTNKVRSKKDVSFLTHIFQNYKNTCESAFVINPLLCYSTPSSTCMAGLEYKGVELDYTTETSTNLK